MTHRCLLLILASLLLTAGMIASAYEVDRYALSVFLGQTGIGVETEKPITTPEKISGFVLVTEKLEKLGIEGTKKDQPVTVVFSSDRDVEVTFPDIKKKAVLFLKNYRWQLKSCVDLEE